MEYLVADWETSMVSWLHFAVASELLTPEYIKDVITAGGCPEYGTYVHVHVK